MSRRLRYLAMAGGLVAFVVLGALLFADGDRRAGLLLAGAVALPVQLAAFGILLRFQETPGGFLAGWLAGTLMRMLGLAGVVVAVVVRDDLDPLWTLLGIAGLFFVLHLLEPLALRGAEAEKGTGTERG